MKIRKQSFPVVFGGLCLFVFGGGFVGWLVFWHQEDTKCDLRNCSSHNYFTFGMEASVTEN